MKRITQAHSSLSGGKWQGHGAAKHCVSGWDLLRLFAFPPSVGALAHPGRGRLERRQTER